MDDITMVCQLPCCKGNIDAKKWCEVRGLDFDSVFKKSVREYAHFMYINDIGSG